MEVHIWALRNLPYPPVWDSCRGVIPEYTHSPKKGRARIGSGAAGSSDQEAYKIEKTREKKL